MPSHPSACPECGDANTQPCHAVFAAGTSSTSSTSSGGGLAIGGDGRVAPVVGIGSSSGVQQTLLARACSPPEKHPALLWLLGGPVGALIIAFGVAFGFAVVFDATPEHAITAGMWSFGLVEALFLVAAITGFHHNATAWPTDYASWRARWVCLRCHHQFEPSAADQVKLPESLHSSKAHASAETPEMVQPQPASAAGKAGRGAAKALSKPGLVVVGFLAVAVALSHLAGGHEAKVDASATPPPVPSLPTTGTAATPATVGAVLPAGTITAHIADFQEAVPLLAKAPMETNRKGPDVLRSFQNVSGFGNANFVVFTDSGDDGTIDSIMVGAAIDTRRGDTVAEAEGLIRGVTATAGGVEVPADAFDSWFRHCSQARTGSRRYGTVLLELTFIPNGPCAVVTGTVRGTPAGTP